MSIASIARSATFRSDTIVPLSRRRFPISPFRHSPDTASRGQSLVEFALVLPMLLVLLLGIADFGRVFAAGIVMEAAARNAAEAAAQEYVQIKRNAPSGSLGADDFDRLHDVALASVCTESEPLPNRSASGSTCSMPVTLVCVRDPSEADPYCGADTAPPAECTETGMAPGFSAPGVDPLPYVEVQVCYRFTTIIDLSGIQFPFGAGLSLGEIWLERARSFTVADY